MPELREARPTFRIDGQDQQALASRLVSLLIAEDTAGLYRAEAVFGNWGDVNGTPGFLYFDRAVLEFGKKFEVLIGTDVIFEGRITALEGRFPEAGPPEIGLFAEDRFQDLRMTRRTRTFENIADSAVMQQIASDHGLSADVNVPGPTHRVLAQVNQSDLAFLRERARAVDAELWIEGSRLSAKARTARASGSPLQMTLGAQLRQFTVLADLAGQTTGLAVNGWDVAGKTAVQHEATDSVVQSELNGGDSGASVLRSALAERKQAVAHGVPVNTSEAQAAAESLFRMAARRFLTGHGVAATDPRLRVGAIVDLLQLGPLFSGKYYVSEIRTLFDGRHGIRTEFAAERPGLGRP